MAKHLATALPPPFRPLSVLKSCGTLAHLKQAHAHLLVSGHATTNHRTTTQLLRLASLLTPPDAAHAHRLFDQIPSPPSYAWTCLFRAHARAKNPAHAALLYARLLRTCLRPNGIVLSYVLSACAGLGHQWLAMAVHAHCVRLGFLYDAMVVNSLVHAYASCGPVACARMILDELHVGDLVSWTKVVNGYARTGCAKEAVELFFGMVSKGVRPDEVAMVAATSACSQLGDLSLGRKVDCLALKFGVRGNAYVVNALLNMYGTCGSIKNARELFERMEGKDVVSWNSMVGACVRHGDMETAREMFDQIPGKNVVSWSLLINGYTQNCCFKEAVRVYHEMLNGGSIPNAAAVTGAATACANLGALDLGREIHLSLDDRQVQSDVTLSTALVDMYAKCGCLEIASSLFESIEKKNLVSWNAMMMGLAVHGKAFECFKLLCRMLKEGYRPNSLTFTGILSAFAYAGWLEEGKDCFTKMTRDYGITPRAEHCSCIVHLMAGAGLVAEACEFIKTFSVVPDAATWGAILSACKIHGYVELVEIVAGRILELNRCHSGAYVQLASTYAAANMWNGVQETRKVMKEVGAKNRTGWSCIELDGMVHEFLAGVTSDSRLELISWVLHAADVHMASTDSRHIA